MTEPADTVTERIREAEKNLILCYDHYDIILDRGEGAFLYDSSGKRYLDFMGGYGVTSLGHCHPALIKAIEEQSGRLMICPGGYLTEPRIKAAKLLTDNCCSDRVFFQNSGAEAVDAAIKIARKWAWQEKGPQASEIICLNRAFHGRTMGAVSLTYKRDSQPYFGPYMQGTRTANINDIQSVRDLISEKTAGIILEPVQGEGGLIPAEKGFLQELREICTREKIAMISDEIQTGMGRMGTLFAHAAFDYEPDILCIAKGMGSGFPVGAVMAKDDFGGRITPGDHGSTYGGNPLACHVVYTVVSEILKPGFLENVRETGAYFMDRLKMLQQKSTAVKDIRGCGLMIGVEPAANAKSILKRLQHNGLMASIVGENTIRFVPPLIIGKKEIDEAMAIFETVLRNDRKQ